MRYVEFFAPLVGSWSVYRLWLFADKHGDHDNPASRHRPL